MRCTCDAEIKPSEIDRAFSSSRYCLLAPARLDALDLLSKKWIKVETTSLISIRPIPYDTLNDLEVKAVLKSSVDLEFKAYVNQRQRYKVQSFDVIHETTASGLFYHFHVRIYNLKSFWFIACIFHWVAF